MTAPLVAQAAVEAGPIPAIVLGGYLLMLLAIGWLGYRRSRTGEEDYYLAGRDQGWLISTLTIIATFLSSFALMGAPGMVYREGVVFALVSLNAPVAGFAIYLLGSRIWRAGKARGYLTQADMICAHYDNSPLLRGLVVLVGLLFAIPYVMMQIQAGGNLAAVLFGDGDRRAFEIGAIVLASITAVYIMIGGMRSVAWTDAIQCVLLLGGMFLAGAAMIAAFGGPGRFAEAVAALPETSLTVPGTTGQWRWPFLFSVCLLMPLGAILQPAQWMRFYSARNPETLRRGAVIFIVVVAGAYLFGIMPVGLGGQALYPLQRTEAGGVAPAAEVGEFDQILVVVLQRQLPELCGETLGVVLSSLFVVAVMAASMSTADSNLHALSAVLTRDVYERALRPRASEAERVWVGRIVILLATAAALVFVLVGARTESLQGFMRMIVDLALFAVAFSVQLLPITVDVLFLRRGTTWGASAGLLAGIVCAFLFTPLFGALVSAVAPQETSWLFALQRFVGDCRAVLPVHATAWGLLANVLIFVGVSAITPRRTSARGGRL